MSKGAMGNLLQQAKKMQEEMKRIQEELARAEVIGESGAGLVRVTMTGRFVVKNVSIDPSLMSEESEILEDLVAAAINDAVRKVEENNRQKMGGLTAGMGIPSDLGSMF